MRELGRGPGRRRRPGSGRSRPVSTSLPSASRSSNGLEARGLAAQAPAEPSEKPWVAFRARTRAFATLGVAAVVLLLAAGFALVRSSGRRLEPELASYMGELQHHTHKLNLAVESENAILAGFYLHEVEEVCEQIERLFPRHDGHAVAELARAMLEPQLLALRGSVESSDWDRARAGVSGLIAGCNGCHAAAEHGFIRIEVTNGNPFNQSFANH